MEPERICRSERSSSEPSTNLYQETGQSDGVPVPFQVEPRLWPPGYQVDRYEIRELIAVGGMAEVYLARINGPRGFTKHCVIKRLPPYLASDVHNVSMFRDETALLATMDHPNIVRVFDWGTQHDSHYMVMDHVDGMDLRSVLIRLLEVKQTLSASAFFSMAIAITEGLEGAHGRCDANGRSLEIVHRDISPSNILVSWDGHIKVTDFGIAKAEKRCERTGLGIVKGKVHFMSPEQRRGSKVDLRTDLYSLGIVLYELVHQSSSVRQANMMQDYERVETLSSRPIPPHLPPGLRWVLRRLLALDVRGRYASASDLRKDLRALAYKAGIPISSTSISATIRSLVSEEEKEPNETEGQSADLSFDELGKTTRVVRSAHKPGIGNPTVIMSWNETRRHSCLG